MKAEFLRMWSDCLKEQGVYSSTRVMAWAAFAGCMAAAQAATAYVLIVRYSWPEYEAFLTFCGAGAFGGLSGAVGNKYLNGKYNSPSGEPFDKGGDTK